MQVRILGPVDVTVSGTPRPVRGLRRKAVLAVLALQPAEIVSTDRLIEVVWGERPPATAANTLQCHVSYLRGVLGGRTAIQARVPGYVLDIGADATDLLVAQRLIRQGKQSTDPATSASHLRRALALWRDRPLVDVAGLAWLEDHAERLAEIQLEAVEALTEARLALGEHAQVVTELERLSQQHPFREHMHRQLMLALYRSGRQVDALATYQRLRHTLGEELGIDPSPALRDLEAAMLRQDPALAPPGAVSTLSPVDERITLRGDSPVTLGVLEREHEIAELAGAAREAAAGAGSVVLLSGEAGIGKSSLVDAVRGVLPKGSRLLVGYCDDLATPRTLGPFRDLAGSVGTRLATALRNGGDRDEVLDALHAELAGHPTILVVEDLHWADEATLDALSYLVRRMDSLPAVLLLTYRGDDLDTGHPLQRLLGHAARARRVRRLELARLSEMTVRRMATSSGLDPSEVFSVTGGNPFFVTEVLASGHTDQVPPTVADAALARANRLDPDTRAALEQLAVIPSTVELWLLEALLPNGIIDVAAAEQRGLLTVSPTRSGFNHELIRRAVVDSLPVARQVQLNRRVLAALIERDDSDLPRLVHHAAQVGDASAIIRYGPRAAREAIRAGSHREAAAHLRLVLEHRQRLDPRQRADLLGSYAVECYTNGDMPAAVAAARDAVEIRRTLGDPRALGADLRFLSRACWAAVEPELMDNSADEAVALLERAGDDRLLALALSHKSSLHLLSDRYRDSVQIGERAVALARSAGDPAILSHALTNVGSAKWRMSVPEGQAMVEESVRMALSVGAVEDACRGYGHLVENLLRDLSLGEVGQCLDAAFELSERTEHLAYRGLFHAHRASLGLATGAWDQAVSDAERAGDGYCPPVTCQIMAVRGRIRVRRGQPGGEQLLADAWGLAQRTRELQNIGAIASARAEAAWLRGDDAAVPFLIESAYIDAYRLGAVAIRAELGYWLAKSGHPVAPDASGHPYALQVAGQWQDAAAVWREAGCTYEYAAALAESTDPCDLLNALDALETLGAEPLAAHVRAKLR